MGKENETTTMKPLEVVAKAPKPKSYAELHKFSKNYRTYLYDLLSHGEISQQQYNSALNSVNNTEKRGFVNSMRNKTNSSAKYFAPLVAAPALPILAASAPAAWAGAAALGKSIGGAISAYAVANPMEMAVAKALGTSYFGAKGATNLYNNRKKIAESAENLKYGNPTSKDLDVLADAAVNASMVVPAATAVTKAGKTTWNSAKKTLNIVGPDGKIFNSKIPWNSNNYYRGVSKSAIEDANLTGVIRGNPTSKQSRPGPWFLRGQNEQYGNEGYMIEGTPESATWINSPKYYYKGEIEELPLINPEPDVIGFGNYRRGFPMTNGSVNATPASNFNYYKKYPLFGWRQKQFKTANNNLSANGASVGAAGENGISYARTPSSASPASPAEDPIKKGLQERANFITWLQDNPEVSFNGSDQVPPELVKKVWENSAGDMAEVNINPGGRIGTFLQYLQNRFKVNPLNKLKIGSSNNFDENIGGFYLKSKHQAEVNIDEPKNFVRNTVHEVGGHSTDAQVLGNPISQYTKQEVPKVTGYINAGDFLQSSPSELFGRKFRTVYDIYHRLANIKMSPVRIPELYKKYKLFSIPANAKDSKLAWEARATLKQLQEQKLHEFNYDQQKYNEYIDNMSLEDMREWLKGANAYGVDYSNNLKFASSKNREQWLNLAKFALKYLPATTPLLLVNKNSSGE